MIELPFLASKPFSRVLDYSQKNHCNDNCNYFSDYNDIIAPLNKLMMSAIMLHYVLVLRDAIMLHHIVRGVKCYCLEKMTKREGRRGENKTDGCRSRCVTRMQGQS